MFSKHFQSRVSEARLGEASWPPARNVEKPIDGEAMSEGTALEASQESGSFHARRNEWSLRGMVGVGFIILAVGAGGYELAALAMSGRYSPVTLGEIWFMLDVGSLNLVQAVIQRFLHPALWDPIIVWLLRWPLWSLLGGPGIALATIYLARRR